MTELATPNTEIQTGRDYDLPTLRDILEDQQARKIDLVIPASQLKVQEGQLVIAGQEHILNEDGFTDPNGTYAITDRFDAGVAEKLDINPGYLRRLRHGKTNNKGKETAAPRLDLYDANVNGLLRGRNAKVVRVGCVADGEPEGGYDFERDSLYFRTVRPEVPADGRSFLVRLFRSDATRRGIARALLSNSFGRLDNLDGCMAILQGIQEAGIDPTTLRITGDITETRMYLHVDAPQIAALAPKFLAGYRSPFGDARIHGGRQSRGYSLEERRAIGEAFNRSREEGRAAAGGIGEHNIFNTEDMPILFAGFDLMNSEVGNGRWMLVPRITVLECSNGYQFTKEAFARTHVGSRMEDGHIAWSADTQTKELAYVTAQTRDLVKLVLSQEFVEGKVAQLEEGCDKPVEEPKEKIEVLGQRLGWTQSERDGIFDHFMRGGQYTAGGVAQAVTSFAQMLDADAGWDLQATALDAMALAAR